MKRFAAFRGDVYYPMRGLGDYVGSFDTADDAIAAAKAKSADGYRDEYEEDTYEWWVVYDTSTDPPTLECKSSK